MTFARVAIFAAGALLGGGVATVLSRTQRSPTSLDPASAVLQIDRLTKDLPILKYGNPGVYTAHLTRYIQFYNVDTAFYAHRSSFRSSGPQGVCCGV